MTTGVTVRDEDMAAELQRGIAGLWWKAREARGKTREMVEASHAAIERSWAIIAEADRLLGRKLDPGDSAKNPALGVGGGAAFGGS